MNRITTLLILIAAVILLSTPGCGEPYQPDAVNRKSSSPTAEKEKETSSTTIRSHTSGLGKAKGAAERTVGDIQQHQQKLMREMEKNK